MTLKREIEWITDISRGHLISRRRTVFLSVVLDTFYYSLWCWYTDEGPVLSLSLSLSLSLFLPFHIFRLILSTQLAPVWKTDQPVGWRLLHPHATRSIRDSPLLLSCSPPISFTYTRGDVRARARTHQLSRFPLPLLSSFRARPYRPELRSQ